MNRNEMIRELRQRLPLEMRDGLDKLSIEDLRELMEHQSDLDIASAVGCVTTLTGGTVITALFFLWVWTVGGLTAAVLAALFLWWIPFTLTYWLGWVLLAPFLVGRGIIRALRGGPPVRDE